MNAKEIYNKAMIMLGYLGSEGISGETEMSRKGITAINLVISDIGKYFKESPKQISSLSDDVNLPEQILVDVMPYGVAMFLAQSEGDGDNQQLFAVLYNRKRVGVPGISRVKFVGPYVED